MMRLTRDLITELDQEASAGNFTEVALAIAFPDGTSLLFNTDPKKLDQLNAYIRGGGQPIGFIGISSLGSHGTNSAIRPLQEYSADRWAEAFLLSVAGMSPTDHNEAQLYF